MFIQNPNKLFNVGILIRNHFIIQTFVFQYSQTFLKTKFQSEVTRQQLYFVTFKRKQLYNNF